MQWGLYNISALLVNFQERRQFIQEPLEVNLQQGHIKCQKYL